MKSTSSRSAKGIRSTAYALDTSGTPHIEETSATISEGCTEWAILMTDGKRYVVTVPGDGRISYGRSASREGAEVRFYRNQTTKAYDAVIPNVLMVQSNRVSIREADKTEAEKDAERKVAEELRVMEAARAKEATEYVAELIMKREYKDDDF